LNRLGIETVAGSDGKPTSYLKLSKRRVRVSFMA